MARILRVNVGRPRPVATGRRTVSTAIWKAPVEGRVAVRGVNLEGDDQADRSVHGGPDKAVYAYAIEETRAWESELGRALGPAAFGENLTTEGLDVTGAVIGERWRIEGADGSPDVVVEVTAPRIPCQTFRSWMGEPQWVRRFTEHGAPGTYLRVLAEGSVRQGSTVEVLHRPTHGVTVGEVFQPRFADPARLQRLLVEGEDLHPPLVRRLQSEVGRAATRAAAPTT
jgi:MOSC domain-containing protein YiiM